MQADFLAMSNQSNRGFLLCHPESSVAFFANTVALSLYGDENSVVDLPSVVQNREVQEELISRMGEGLNQHGFAEAYDVVTTTVFGEERLADIYVGYTDEGRSSIFVEFIFKKDKRFEVARNGIDTSLRGGVILNADVGLSLLYGNTHFYDIFEADSEIFSSVYGEFLSSTFVAPMADIWKKQIFEGLKNSPVFNIELEIVTVYGKKHWYSLDLQRKSLDDTGDKLLGYLVPVEGRVQLTRESDSMSQYFNALQDLSEDIFFRIHLEERILYCREDKANLFGIDDIMENFPHSLCNSGMIHGEDVELFRSFGLQVLAGLTGSVGLRMKTLDGDFSYCRIFCAPVRRSDGSFLEMFGKFSRSISDGEVDEKDKYDGLTGVLNKEAMAETTELVLEQSTKEDYHAIFYLDLDNFEYVNRNLGHHFGDFLLKELARRLEKNVRHGDLVGRVGGDEFLLFLRDISTVDMLIGKAKSILSAINEEIYDGTQGHSIKGSIGIAMFPDQGISYEELYHHADIALFRSKMLGKNVATIYSTKLDDLS